MVKKKNSNSFRHRRSGGPGRSSGVALIIALICLFVISTMTVGILYTTQSEIWTTGNYRAVTQARYIAEAGAQEALTVLQDNNPLTGAAGTAFLAATANFDLNTVPIKYKNASPMTINTTAGPIAYPAYVSGTPTTGVPVIFATPNISFKFADTFSGIDTAMGSSLDPSFQGQFGQTVTQTPFAGIVPNCVTTSCPQVNVAVQLLSATQASPNKWLTRWKIVSEGSLKTIGGSGSFVQGPGQAMVQVVEVVDNVKVVGSAGSAGPTFTAGVFGTGTGCNTITFAGGQYTKSYSSTAQPGNANPALTSGGGDVGSFGNISVQNGAYIYGNVYTPFYNVGTAGTYGVSGGPSGGKNPPACSTASGGTEYSVNEDNSGSQVGCTAGPSCTQKTFNLPSPPPSYPTPTMPSVATNTAACAGYNGLCSGGSGGGSGCAITIPPSAPSGAGAANFGAVNFGSCSVITLQAGTYNMDSLLVSNGAQIILPATGNVVINILDQGATVNPLNINGGSVSNSGGAPIHLTIAYAGTKTINIANGTAMFGTIYAPNASATVSGNGGLYGAMVAKTVAFSGSGHVIYDTALAGQAWNVTTAGAVVLTPGNLHIDEFSWSAY